MQLRYTLESIYRNRGRYALFGILFAALGAAWLITLLLGTAANALQEKLLDEYGRAVVLEDRAYSRFPITEQICDTFNDPSLVESMQITAFVQANIVGSISPIEPKPTAKPNAAAQNYYHVAGYTYTGEYTPFNRQDNRWELVRGRLPEADHECMLFEDYYQDLLKVSISGGDEGFTGLGDKIYPSMYIVLRNWGEGTQAGTRSLTVVGTVDRDSIDDSAFRGRRFYTIHPKTGMPIGGKYREPVIFTTISEARNYIAYGESEPGVLGHMRTGDIPLKYEPHSRAEAVYHLHNVDDFAAFADMVYRYNHARALDEITADFENVETRQDALKMYSAPSGISARASLRARLWVEGIETLVAPLKTLGELSAQMSRNLTLLASVLFLILTVLNLYARTYEIGVLRCVGMSRSSITRMLLVENLLFLLAALGLGLGLGILVADRVLPLVIAETYHGYLDNAMTGLLRPTLRILGMGLLLSLIASLGAGLYIQRCRPLAILRNRS